MIVYVVIAVDGYSAPRITVFKESALAEAEQYARNMEQDGWACRVNKEIVMFQVPVNQKHNIGFNK